MSNSYGYITRAHRNRLVRAALTSFLSTRIGANAPISEIARSLRCGEKTVRSVKRDLTMLGLLGVSTSVPQPLQPIPAASFDDLACRVFEALDLVDQLELDGVKPAIIRRFRVGLNDALAALREDGAMPRRFPVIGDRISQLENEIEEAFDAIEQATPEERFIAKMSATMKLMEADHAEMMALLRSYGTQP